MKIRSLQTDLMCLNFYSTSLLIFQQRYKMDLIPLLYLSIRLNNNANVSAIHLSVFKSAKLMDK